MTLLRFRPKADIVDYLEKLYQLTGLNLDDVLDELLRPVLIQIFEGGDSDLLGDLFQRHEFDDQNHALAAIGRYEAFCQKFEQGYHAPAKLRRTPEGKWQILFKADLPDGPIYA